MNTAIICSGLLGILLFALSFNVSMKRGKLKKGVGIDDDPTSGFTKLARAQGNAAEYIPAFMVLFLILGSRDPANWVVWTMIIATVCRYSHAIGMFASKTLDEPNALRFIGAAGTYLTGLILSVMLLLEAF